MGAGTYTYHATKVHAVTAANGNSYAYDAVGNMTTRNSSTYGNQTLTYDEQNRLTQVAISGGSTVQFGYAAGGSRLWKKVEGNITGLWIGSLYEEKDGKILCHVYAGDRLVATFEPESALACIIQNNRYLAALWNTSDWALTTFFGGGRSLVTVLWAAALAGIALGLRYNRRRLRDRYGLQTYYGLRAFGGTDPWRQMVLLTTAAAVFLASNPQAAYADTPTYDPVFYYYHPDHLGSAQIMTDRNGELVQQYGYTPFGNENYQNNTYAFSVSNRYTGQTLDEDTGLYYYGARYYDPELARFIQADSVVPEPGSSQAYNRYTYCLNNPLRLIDPSGNSSQAWSSEDITAMLSDPYGYPSENLPDSDVIGGVSDLMRFPEGRRVVVMYLNGGASALSSYMMGGPAIAQAFENAFVEDGDLKFGFDSFTVGEVKRLFEAKERLKFSEYKLRKLTITATEMAMSEAASAGVGYGLGALARALRRAGAGARAWSPVREMVELGTDLSSYTDDAARASNGVVSWNNGWRTPDGKFASPLGPGSGRRRG